jgi:uncharacterized UBP type Zn finger protein
MFEGLYDEEDEAADFGDWPTDFEDAARAPPPPAPPRTAPLCGLMNQGNTCYMNSLLQVLYLTPEFRRAVYALTPQELGLPTPECPKPTVRPRQILIALQQLFATMQSEDVATTETTELTNAFGWGGSSAVYQQHDLQELKDLLMDALQHELAGTTAAHVLAGLFHGTYANTIVVDQCEALPKGLTRRLADESFADVHLAMAGSAFGGGGGLPPGVDDSLEAALERKVTFELLDGANQYDCAEAGGKVDAQKGVVFAKLPPVLSFTLLRFEMNWALDPPGRSKARAAAAATLPLPALLSDLISVLPANHSVAWGGSLDAATPRAFDPSSARASAGHVARGLSAGSGYGTVPTPSAGAEADRGWRRG